MKTGLNLEWLAKATIKMLMSFALSGVRNWPSLLLLCALQLDPREIDIPDDEVHLQVLCQDLPLVLTRSQVVRLRERLGDYTSRSIDRNGTGIHRAYRD